MNISIETLQLAAQHAARMEKGWTCALRLMPKGVSITVTSPAFLKGMALTYEQIANADSNIMVHAIDECVNAIKGRQAEPKT